MYIPIKRRNRLIKNVIVDLEDLRSSCNPNFNYILSSIRIGKVFKTSKLNRLPLLTEWLATNIHHPKVIIDVGASDGSASIGVLEALKPSIYYLTDKDIILTLKKYKNFMVVFSSENKPCVIQFRNFIFYIDHDHLFMNPIERIVTCLWNLIIGRSRPISSEFVTCVIQEILSKPEVVIIQYDVTQRWDGVTADLLLVANLLDKFIKDEKRLCGMLYNIFETVHVNGYLAVAENSNIEKASIYQNQDGSLMPLYHINGGSAINSLVMKLYPTYLKNRFTLPV